MNVTVAELWLIRLKDTSELDSTYRRECEALANQIQIQYGMAQRASDCNTTIQALKSIKEEWLHTQSFWKLTPTYYVVAIDIWWRPSLRIHSSYDSHVSIMSVAHARTFVERIANRWIEQRGVPSRDRVDHKEHRNRWHAQMGWADVRNGRSGACQNHTNSLWAVLPLCSRPWLDMVQYIVHVTFLGFSSFRMFPTARVRLKQDYFKVLLWLMK